MADKSPNRTLYDYIETVKPLRDFNDHFYVSFKHRYAFHTVGKAANSTVKHTFYRYELRDTHYRLPSVHVRLCSPLLSPFQLDERLLREIFFGRSFFRFTFIRNPYSRLLSCYLDRIKNMKSRPYIELIGGMGKSTGYDPSFEEFITFICRQDVHAQNNHWRVQTADALCGLIDYDFIGRQEQFSVDLARLIHQVVWCRSDSFV